MLCPPLEEWKLVKVYDTDFRIELIELFNVISKLELWDFIKNNKPPDDTGYIFWENKTIDSIYKELKTQHSAATFAYSLRQMHSIAIYGFDSWNKMK